MAHTPQAIPWEPIPHASNFYTEIGVLHVEQLAKADGVPVAIVVRGLAPRGEPPQLVDTAWRLTFHFVAAFRNSHIGLADPPFPWPVEEARGRPRLWEVVHSPWLEQVVKPGIYATPTSYHHYVITDFDAVYEVAAQWWEVEELGEVGAVPAAFDLARPRTKLPPL